MALIYGYLDVFTSVKRTGQSNNCHLLTKCGLRFLDCGLTVAAPPSDRDAYTNRLRSTVLFRNLLFVFFRWTQNNAKPADAMFRWKSIP